MRNVEWNTHPPKTANPSATASPPDRAPASLVQDIPGLLAAGLVDGFTHLLIDLGKTKL